MKRIHITGQIKLLLILALVHIQSCQSSKKLLNDGETFAYNCPGIISYNVPEFVDVLDYANDSILNANYTINNLHIANAFGLLDDLKVYEELRQEIRSEGKVDPNTFDEFTGAYNRINEGMNLAALEVKSLQDLLDCSILKLRKYKFQVSNENLKTQNSLSNWAIGVGAATTIITAGILVAQNDELIASTAFDWMAVAGGVVTGYLAFKSAKVNKEIKLSPQNNFIRVIWTGVNENNLFPASSWYLLNQPYFENGEETTMRDTIIQDWKESENMLGDPDNMEVLPLLIKGDGIYNEQLIDLRMEMLETVGLGVDQVNRALYLFNSKRY